MNVSNRFEVLCVCDYRFSINLSTDSESNSDLALHFNPRIDRRLVIRNHKIKNK